MTSTSILVDGNEYVAMPFVDEGMVMAKIKHRGKIVSTVFCCALRYGLSDADINREVKLALSTFVFLQLGE